MKHSLGILDLLPGRPEAILCVTGPSTLADPERCREMLREAGFEQIDVRAQLEEDLPVVYAIGWMRSS
ncbi:MAG TPA: hypothetical protein VF157_03040 [Chloroflexota bacterium]